MDKLLHCDCKQELFLFINRRVRTQRSFLAFNYAAALSVSPGAYFVEVLLDSLLPILSLGFYRCAMTPSHQCPSRPTTPVGMAVASSLVAVTSFTSMGVNLRA